MYPVPIFCRICSQLILHEKDLFELLTFDDESRIIIYLHKGCRSTAPKELIEKILKDVQYDIWLSDDDRIKYEC